MSADQFGAHIRALREARGVSLRQFARQVSVSATYMSKVELCEFPPPGEETISKIAELLGEDRDELLALGGKVAPDLLEIIKQYPTAAAALLRENFRGESETRFVVALTEERRDALLEGIRLAIERQGEWIVSGDAEAAMGDDWDEEQEKRTVRHWGSVAASLGGSGTQRAALALVRTANRPMPLRRRIHDLQPRRR
jgi:transcriptional regulator with XRE-family HTH domain